MQIAIPFGVVGFVAGVTVALALTQLSSQQVIPAQELHVLWPTAALGLDFSGWADGNAWDFMRLLMIFAGNGLVYALAACSFAGLIEILRK